MLELTSNVSVHTMPGNSFTRTTAVYTPGGTALNSCAPLESPSDDRPVPVNPMPETSSPRPTAVHPPGATALNSCAPLEPPSDDRPVPVASSQASPSLEGRACRPGTSHISAITACPSSSSGITVTFTPVMRSTKSALTDPEPTSVTLTGSNAET